MVELDSRFIVKRPTRCEWTVRQGEQTFEVDLAAIHRAQARQSELATVNRVSAQELAAIFNEAYDSSCKLHARIIYEQGMSAIASRKRRAIMLRDVLPGRIRDRGLSSSRAPLGAEDIRKDMLYEDDEYVELEQYRAALDALKELLFGKMMAMKSAHDDAQAVIGRGHNAQLPGTQQDPDGDMVGRGMERALTEHTAVTAPPRKSGFGIPKD